ncbi:hypothetical protein [Brevibacterium otitidis]|uniref:Uncharacterized protein n=1 Tax=Brevibacterium otitidis TaxID=53364 RepID=A0ABV5X6H2_9MICO|nr:hypothetical protein GCM10023233_01110 [Brevibacterium otitidis]
MRSTPHSAHRPRRLRIVGALLCLLLTGGPLSACTKPAKPLPESTYADLVSEVEGLAGVTAVTRAGTDVTVTVEADTDPDALDDTAEALLARVNDYRYPQGPPEVRVESGRFTGTVGHTVRNTTASVPQPGPLNLSQLPFLTSLPDVADGEIGENMNASVTLTFGTDMRTWLTDATGQRELVLGVRRAAAADEVDLVEHAPGRDESDGEPSITASVDMSEPGVQDAITRFYYTAEQAGSLPFTVQWTNSLERPNATVLVEHDADIPDVLDVFTAEYGAGELSDLTAGSAEGLRVEFGDGRADADAYFQARDLLAERGITVEHIALNRQSMNVVAPSSTELRELADLLSGSTWPLPGDVELSVSNTAYPDDSSTFPAAEWPAHADLLTALWDAGFTSVRMSEYVGGTGADFRLDLHQTDSQDLTSAAGQDALIEVLRDTGWDGRALITLATGGHPTFTATERGKATGARMSLHGVDPKPTGWAKEFLDRFDATAG